MEKWLERKEYLLLKGPRQSGKTTLLLHLKELLKNCDGPIPVEVKTGRAKVGRGFVSFLKSYRPKRAVVFTEEGFGIREIAGTKVAFLPHYFV